MDAYLIVDPDSRNITIPEIESAFGVYGDNNAERKYFKSPRIVGNGIDLTECYLYVNYISASTKIGQILCDVGDAPNGTATEDEIVFSWPITRNVLDKNVSGEIFFAVQAKTKTGDTVFTTRKAKGNCYESIEGTEAVTEEYADIVLQLISRMDKVEENIGEQVAAYFKENPAVTSEYLIQTLQPIKDDVGSIKEDLGNYIKYKEHIKVLEQDNIYNANTVTVGAIGSNGTINPSKTDFVTIDYEYVKAGEIYSAWQKYGPLKFVNLCGFDKDKKFIKMLTVNVNIVTIPYGVYYIRSSFDAGQATVERQPRIVVGSENKKWSAYRNEYVDKEIITEYVKKDLLHELLKPRVYIPDVIYCALGRTIDIYNNQVCINAYKFHICWTCDIGFGEGRKFTAKPTEVGEHNLKLDIYNDANELLYTKTVILKVVSAITSGNYTILPMGDSMTYGGGQWQMELQKNLSNGAMTYVGTQKHEFREGTYKHEGYNGNTANGFLNNATLRGLTNPFYNPDTSKFDWNYYKNTYSINPDIIQIELGTNDVNGYTVDVAVEKIAEMVDLIREDDATIPIFICNAIFRSNQDGIAHQLNTQGYSVGSGVYKYNEDMKIQNLMIGLADRLSDYTNTFFMPIAFCHDSENNFGKQTIKLNSRSKETVSIPADSIHPNKTGEDASIYGYDIVGYLQFADVMYSTLCGILPTIR